MSDDVQTLAQVLADREQGIGTRSGHLYPIEFLQDRIAALGPDCLSLPVKAGFLREGDRHASADPGGKRVVAVREWPHARYHFEVYYEDSDMPLLVFAEDELHILRPNPDGELLRYAT